MGTVVLYLILSLPLVGTYALLGAGITVIYQASRVLNLAHGAMATAGAYITYQLALWKLPLALAVVMGVLSGALLGLVVERVFIRRLRSAGPTTQTVGTVAVLTMAIALSSRIWGTLPVNAPRVLPQGTLRVGSGFVSYDLVGIFPIAVAVAALLFALFKFTDIGLAMRGAAQNRRGAALRGVNPDVTASLAWALGGGLAALAGILLAGATQLNPFTVSLGVLPAFVAALIGGLESMPGVFAGAAVVGIVQGMVPALAGVPYIGSIVQQQGAPELVLGVLALVVMALRGQRLVASDVRSEGLAGAAPPRAGRADDKMSTRSRAARSTLGMTAVVTALVVWPLLPGVPYDLLNTAILACQYAVVAFSLVLLIGMVGQISLAQAALVGIGAFVASIFTRHFGVEFPLSLIVGLVAGALMASILGVVALRVRGLYLAVATLIFAYVCDQYLFTQTWLVETQSGTTIKPEQIGQPGSIPSFNLADAHIFYYVALAIAIVVLFSLANLRESRIGRAFSAIRGSEVAAASLGVNVMRFKLLGFATAGALAGLAGGLDLVGHLTVSPVEFTFTNSLYFLSIAVVGGLRSLGGAIASAVFFALLVGEVFFRSPELATYLDVISAALLITVLLFFQGGLGALPDRLQVLRPRVMALLKRVRVVVLPRREQADTAARSAWGPGVFRALRPVATQVSSVPGRLGRMVPRRPEAAIASPAGGAGATGAPLDVVGLIGELKRPASSDVLQPGRLDRFQAIQGGVGTVIDEEEKTSVPDALTAELFRAARERREVAGTEGPGGRRLPILLSAESITVRFGGLTAVSHASLHVGAGEVVGLIGPNGAGKTTLFNSILGLNQPAEGRVALFDHDVTDWDVHRRAALGVGRTFQILQLFGDLTVFDNLMVATHLQNRTGLWGSIVAPRSARKAELTAAERVEAVLDLMGLKDVADRHVAGLPFGMLRLIEVARTLVTGARLVCFDEPASGLDSTETERLLEWFRFLRQIGITLLVIEHDVDFVVRLCDWIYVLDQGRLLADGPPTQIQANPAVIASYLGAPMEVA